MRVPLPGVVRALSAEFRAEACASAVCKVRLHSVAWLRDPDRCQELDRRFGLANFIEESGGGVGRRSHQRVPGLLRSLGLLAAAFAAAKGDALY